MYLLPDTPDNYEQFQWLGQEIQRERGETILLRVDQIENMSRADIIRLFHEAATRRPAARHSLPQGMQPWSGRRRGEHSSRRDLTQLQKDFEKLRELDFFDAPGTSEVERLREAIDMRKRPPKSARRRDKPALDLRPPRAPMGHASAAPRGPHRLGLAHQGVHRSGGDLPVRRPAEIPPDAIPFDTPKAELSHDGNDCTFETLLNAPACGTAGSGASPRSFRGGPSRRQVPARRGARDRLAIRGFLAAYPDDNEVLAHGLALFEGLYAGASRKE